MSSNSSWYAVTVKPRHEKSAALGLASQGFEPLSPTYRAKRRWSDRIKDVDFPLFAGYVFCRFSSEERVHVLMTAGVTSIVGFGRTPAAVDEGEIDSLRTIASSGLPARPWPYLRAGQRVRVEEGCLQGLTGTLLRERDLWRVVVNVELLQRSVAVEVDRSAIRAVPERIAATRAAAVETVCRY